MLFLNEKAFSAIKHREEGNQFFDDFVDINISDNRQFAFKPKTF